MRSRHSVEEKFEIVREALTESTTQADICRRHGIFQTQLAKWKEQHPILSFQACKISYTDS